ncbi:hypothetical protein ACFX1X_004402 [Malus domestica]
MLSIAGKPANLRAKKWRAESELRRRSLSLWQSCRSRTLKFNNSLKELGLKDSESGREDSLLLCFSHLMPPQEAEK